MLPPLEGRVSGSLSVKIRTTESKGVILYSAGQVGRLYFSSSESMQRTKSFTLISCTPTSNLPAATTNLITLPERAFLWFGAFLRPPLPPPQHGDRTRQDQSLPGQDRRRGLAQLSHREDGTVWQGHLGRTRQRFYSSRLVIKQENFLTFNELHLTGNIQEKPRSWC